MRNLCDSPAIWTDDQLLADTADLRRAAYLLATDPQYREPTPRGRAVRELRIKLSGLAYRLECMIGGGE